MCINSTLSLRLLRCFGNKISRLQIRADKHVDHLLEYAIQYCRAALNEIAICINEEIGYYPHPFKNAKDVCIERNVLTSNALLLFPNVKELDLNRVFFSKDFSGIHMPKLESLTILPMFDYYKESGDHIEKCLMSLFHENHQLKCLRMEIWFSYFALSKLLELIGGHPLISELSLHLSNSIPQTDENFDENAIHLRKLLDEIPSITSLYLTGYFSRPEDIVNFCSENKSLKLFQFCLKKEDQSHFNRLATLSNGKRKIGFQKWAYSRAFNLIELKRRKM